MWGTYFHKHLFLFFFTNRWAKAPPKRSGNCIPFIYKNSQFAYIITAYTNLVQCELHLAQLHHQQPVTCIRFHCSKRTLHACFSYCWEGNSTIPLRLCAIGLRIQMTGKAGNTWYLCPVGSSLDENGCCIVIKLSMVAVTLRPCWANHQRNQIKI